MRKERKTCPFFLFIQNPRDGEGRGSMTCTHASPNIGNDSLKKKDRKYCDEGSYISQSHSKKCRILTNFLKKGSFQSMLGEYND